MDRPLHDLVGDDRFYEAVNSRLENPDARNQLGYTLLHVAAWSGEENSGILQLLLDRNADVNSTAQHKYTPLHIAVGYRKRKAVASFLDAGASVNCRDDLGRTPLHFAIHANWTNPPNPTPSPPCDMWIVERLLGHPGVDLDSANAAGITPLMWAVMRKNADAVRALLNKGADPSRPDSNHQTPLHVALSSSDPSLDIVFDLLSNGVSIYCEDRFGRTPMDSLIRSHLSDGVRFKVVSAIVLRHRVRESLLLKLRKIPRLHKYYEKCLREVRLMKREMVYQNFSLHDFASGRCPLGMSDPLQDVFVPVVRILLSAPFPEYSDFILKRMTTRNLCRILGRTSKAPGIEKLFENSMPSLVFWAIQTLYCYPL